MKGRKNWSKVGLRLLNGGLGSPVLTYLTSAGVGTIRIFHDDVASESNLNREFLHNTEDVGKLKTLSAKEKLIIER